MTDPLKPIVFFLFFLPTAIWAQTAEGSGESQLNQSSSFCATSSLPGTVYSTCQDPLPIQANDFPLCNQVSGSFVLNPIDNEKTPIPCGVQEEYVSWARFTASDEVATLAARIDVYDIYGWAYWSPPVAIAVYAEDCLSEPLICATDVSQSDPLSLDTLTPGTEYLIAFWSGGLYLNTSPYYDPYYSCPYEVAQFQLFLCKEEVDCYPPQGLHIQNVEAFSAVADWSAITEDEWELEYGPSGFILGQGTRQSGIGPQSAYQIEGLDDLTTYDYYLRTICDNLSLGEWVGPVTFTTDAAMTIDGPNLDRDDMLCDDDHLPPTMEVDAYCDSVYITFEDDTLVFDSYYEVHRTITANDTCGGTSVSDNIVITLYPNNLPCDCEGIAKGNHGRSVSVDGDRAAVRGWQSVFIKRLEEGVWQEHAEISSPGLPPWSGDYEFSIELEGDRLLVANELYELQSDVWTSIQTFAPSLGDIDIKKVALYGTTVALKSATHVSVFEEENGVWTEEFIIEADQATDLALGEQMLIIGDKEVAFYLDVYGHQEETWVHQQTLTPFDLIEEESLSGCIALDDGRLAVGNIYSAPGVVHTYTLDGDVWTNGQALINDQMHSPDAGLSFFGSSVAIDGNTMAVGDINNTDAQNFGGAVVLFRWLGGQWVSERQIIPVDRDGDERFGGTVALSGDILLVGHEDRQYFGLGGPDTGHHWFVSCIGAVAGCAEDIDGDGMVDINDFIMMNTAFGSSCSDCPEDVNGDGAVDIQDFLQMSSLYGSPCN